MITGRTHQIRAQLAAVGHPLLGDGKYGSEKLNQPYRERHQALWSYRADFGRWDSSGPLGYLRGKRFTVTEIPFVDRFFPGSV